MIPPRFRSIEDRRRKQLIEQIVLNGDGETISQQLATLAEETFNQQELEDYLRASFLTAAETSQLLADALVDFYTAQEVDDILADGFYSRQFIDAALQNINDNTYTQAEIDVLLTGIVDTTYTQTQVDSIITNLQDNTYTQAQVDALLLNLGNIYYTEAEVDMIVNGVIQNTYTRTAVDTLLSNLLASVYTQAQIGTILSAYYTRSEVDVLLANLPFAQYSTTIQMNQAIANAVGDRPTNTQLAAAIQDASTVLTAAYTNADSVLRQDLETQILALQNNTYSRAFLDAQLQNFFLVFYTQGQVNALLADITNTHVSDTELTTILNGYVTQTALSGTIAGLASVYRTEAQVTDAINTALTDYVTTTVLTQTINDLNLGQYVTNTQLAVDLANATQGLVTTPELNQAVQGIEDTTYTRTVIDNLINAINATITDLTQNTYTQAQVNALITNIQNTTYTRSTVDSFINPLIARVTALEDGTYTTVELDALLDSHRDEAITALTTHENRQDNPHNVTAVQVGAIPSTEKGSANGVATLDSNSKIPVSLLPARAIPSVHVVADIAERDALTVEEGDEAIILAGGEFIYDGATWVDRPSSGSNVTGAGSSTDTEIPTFSGTTGKILASGSGLSVTGTGEINGRVIANDGIALDNIISAFNNFIVRTDNPFGVTAAQVGSYTTTETDTAIITGVALHADRTDNPHSTTAGQVGAYTQAETNTQISTAVNNAIATYAARTDNPNNVTASQTGAYTQLEADNAILAAVSTHENRQDNPHLVTAAQTGAFTQAETNTAIATAVNAHANLTGNPHSTTAADVGAYTTVETDTQITNAVSAASPTDGGQAISATQASAISSGINLGLEQKLLADAGQPALTVLSVGLCNTGKVQGVSLGKGNVVEVYANGNDFLNGILLEDGTGEPYREFMGFGEPICFTNVPEGAIITSTQGFYGVGENINGTFLSPMPLLSFGLSFKETFLFAFRSSAIFDTSPNFVDNAGKIIVVNGPVSNVIKLTSGAGVVIQGQENIQLAPWQRVILGTQGNQEYILSGTESMMACIVADDRIQDCRLVMPLSNDILGWSRNGFASAPYADTQVEWFTRDGATGFLNSGLGVNPGSPIDLDAAPPLGTGAADQEYEPNGATRLLATGLTSAFSGADGSGIEATPFMPVTAMSQIVAQPFHIGDFGDGRISGVAIASTDEGTARIYQWNDATGNLDLQYTLTLDRTNVSVTSRNDQNHPTAALLANNALATPINGDLGPGVIIADVPVMVVAQNGNQALTPTIRSQNGTTTTSIETSGDESLMLGLTTEEIRAEIRAIAPDGLRRRRVLANNGNESWEIT